MWSVRPFTFNPRCETIRDGRADEEIAPRLRATFESAGRLFVIRPGLEKTGGLTPDMPVLPAKCRPPPEKRAPPKLTPPPRKPPPPPTGPARPPPPPTWPPPLKPPPPKPPPPPPWGPAHAAKERPTAVSRP